MYRVRVTLDAELPNVSGDMIASTLAALIEFVSAQDGSVGALSAAIEEIRDKRPSADDEIF